MSQTKAQLIAPIGIVTAPRVVASGVITATTFVGDVSGNVTGITSNTDNLYVGILTATTFVGDFTGIADSITKGSNVVAGIITASKFVGNSTGTVVDLADDTNINVGIITATQFVGNSPGLSAGISAAKNINVGVLTATGGFYGSASGMTGVSVGPVSQQAVTADSANTTIDIGSGNLVYLNQSANTTIGLGTTGTTNELYIVRVKDATNTARTITWPSTIVWDGGSEPTLSSKSEYTQVFKLTTRDNGATWYGYQSFGTPKNYELWVWGANGKGALGQNNLTRYSSPIQIPGSWITLSGQDSHNSGNYAGAIKAGNELWSWGYNYYGSLGQNLGEPGARSSPVQIPGTTWDSVFLSKNSLAIKTDGTLWAWGHNGYGQLGDNSSAHKSSPVQVPGTTWSKLATGNYAKAGAIKTDGTLWTWGSNSYGALGHNDRTNRSSPIQVPGTTWDNVSLGGADGSAVSVKTDGTLWTWGYNAVGQLGLNDKTKYSSPVQVPGTTWSKASEGSTHSVALKTDGTIWAWGENEYGQLGVNNRTNYSSPIQIPGTTWTDIQAGFEFVAGTKTDGSVWTWGNNWLGALGQNNTTRYSSPVQVPGTWAGMGAYGEFVFVFKDP